MEQHEQCVVLDIGGGSTEISFKSEGVFNHKSINIGSVRLYENYFRESHSEIKIKEASGTLTTLSAIKHGMKKFDENIIHKDILHLQDVKNIFEKLISMNDEEILDLGEYMKGRSEIILSGTLILITVMEFFGLDAVTVSVKGLRYGLMYKSADFL